MPTRAHTLGLHQRHARPPPPWTAETLAALTDDELREAYVKVGGKPTPVTPSTRSVIVKSIIRKQAPAPPPPAKQSAWKQERYPNHHPPNSLPATTTTFTSAGVTTSPYNPNAAWDRLQTKLKVDAVVPNCAETPCPPGHTRWVCISDTHGHVNIDEIPKGDVLVHAGDLTNTGGLKEIKEFCTWMDSMPHKHKVVIAGNHDITLDPEYYADSFARFHFKGKQDDATAVAAMRECVAFAYLEDGSTTICGYSVYGSPWQPEFCDWAFNLERGEPCARRWRAIPDETEILVTHGPPVGHGDLCKGSSQRAGCVDLLAEITNRVKPLYHVFGHVHEGYGQTTDGTTNYINASTCTFNYRPTNKPIVFDLPNKSTE